MPSTVAPGDIPFPSGAHVTITQFDAVSYLATACWWAESGWYDPNEPCDAMNWYLPHCTSALEDAGGGSSGGGGGGGGGGDPSSVDPAACDYTQPPRPNEPGSCNTFLTATDKVKIESARQFIRTPDEFTNDSARDDCHAILIQMNQYLKDGKCT